MADLTGDVALQCRALFSTNGRLSTAIPGFVARESQVQLALAIADVMQSRSQLVAEAGTGTGKTFAYLIPCLLSGKKALISTATKTLQDQLFHKDLPVLIRALGLSVRVQNLKGRANYICHYRLKMHAEEGRFVNPQVVHEVISIQEKLSQLVDGERGELTDISEDSAVWPYVTSTSDNCLGTECEFYQKCFLVKARRRAQDASLVVINHHLYFAHERLKEEGIGELLPGVDTVVFDEAHQLPEIATHFFGVRVSTRQFRDLFDDMLREWPLLDLANQPLKQLDRDLEVVLANLHAAVPDDDRFSFAYIEYQHSFRLAWDALSLFCQTLGACFASIDLTEHTGLLRCKERLDGLAQLLQSYQQSSSVHIRWVECFKHSLTFHATPVDIAETFKAQLSRLSCAAIFTSATLTMAQKFDCFLRLLGIENAKTLLLPSPFDFNAQALLYLPRGMPDPKDERYSEQLILKALPVIQAFGGRCFFLFTSHRALKDVARLLAPMLSYPLLVQGEEAKPILLARFRQLGNAVLLGTATFWEGVDVKGDALSCVIIDKLPFSSPADPVIHGRMAYLKARGLSGFDELALPGAILTLKQGVGRLIRDAADRGVLMIADPRLTSRSYGQFIFESLPKMRKTRDERTVCQFIQDLA